MKIIADNELKFLSARMKDISENPALSSKFGNSFESALAVSGLIKQRSSELMYQKILDGYSAPLVNSNKEVGLLAKGGGIRFT